MSEPTAKAFRFVIVGTNQQYDAYLDLVQGIGQDKFIDCRYRPINSTQDKWTWLAGPSMYPSEVDTTEKADIRFNACIVSINAKIKEVFNSADPEIPLKGFERIEWLIQVGLSEIDNVISRKTT